jgi:hypothetical protein
LRLQSAIGTTIVRGYRVLSALRQSAPEPLYEQSLGTIPDGAAEAGGIRVGKRAARAMLAAREGDGRDGPRQPVFGTEPGVWRPTPPAFAVSDSAWIGDVEPFLIQEVIDSHVWGGIHWRTADVVGARLGKRAARWERSRYFKPTRRRVATAG